MARMDGTGAVLMTLVLVAGLAATLVARSPTALQETGLRDGVLILAELSVCSAFALWGRHHRGSPPVQNSLRIGARIGGVLVAIELVNLGLEHAVGDVTVSAIRGVTSWGAMFLAFGVAGSVAAQDAPSVSAAMRRSLIASGWCGVIGALGAVAGGMALAACFMPAMIRILVPHAAELGTAAARSHVVRHTLEAASQHLLLMPLVATGFGSVGAAAALGIRPLSRSTARTLVPIVALTAVGGLVLLRVASALPRTEWPPFVRFGLVALGITLASAEPLLRAARLNAAVAE
ncbi:MAG: hypothetical protein NVS4B3_26590 [Gemmatimonadaceae bacterium]